MDREHGEHKRDKARRCSRLVRPLGDRKKRNASSCSVSLTTRTGSSSSLCRSVSSRSLGGERGPRVFASEHFLHYFSEEIQTAERGIRTAENTPHALR
jgi:hypothetical protein